MTRRQTRTASTSSQSGTTQTHSARAVISGHVLKLIRESLQLTQELLAERLAVEVNTVQGWESGRRPLTATAVSSLMRLRQRLRGLGAPPELLDSLQDAIDTDCFVDYLLTTDRRDVEPTDHPLATWVMTRSFHEMIAWPMLGIRPTPFIYISSARRRGPVPTAPTIDRPQRDAVFENLRLAVERSLSSGTSDSEQGHLLRRQAYFLSSLDRSEDMRFWLETMATKENDRLPKLDTWSPGWVTARSMAVARARVGDPEPLRWFISRGLASDDGQSADLNYWAYWLGLIPETHHGDSFMVETSFTWPALSLLRRLIDILEMSTTTADIYIHSIWSLLHVNPNTIHQDLGKASQLYRRTSQLMSNSAIGLDSRQKLESLYYGLQLAIPNLKSLPQE